MMLLQRENKAARFVDIEDFPNPPHATFLPPGFDCKGTALACETSQLVASYGSLTEVGYVFACLIFYLTMVLGSTTLAVSQSGARSRSG